MSDLSRAQKDRIQAELRWVFVKKYIEPHIKIAANDDSAIGLLPNHEYLIRSTAKAQCIVKCRKTAHSWCIAADALARAITEPRSTSIIMSYDEDEAKAKNYFLDWQYGVLPEGIKREMRMTDGSEERRFANGSRIKMISRKAPTGAGATIYVDEFSVEGKAGVSSAEILIAAIGCTTHTGYLRVGGTQRGPETLFNKIVTGQWRENIPADLSGFPVVEWEVGEFPWWVSPALCTDTFRATIEAPKMATYDRVAAFGNEKLKTQYLMYCQTPEQGEEMFRREFEMIVLDDNETYFPLELIRSCTVPKSKESEYYFVRADLVGGDSSEKALSVLRQLASQYRTGKIKGELCAAMDVARDKDKAVITIASNDENDRSLMQVRCIITMSRVTFPTMKEIWWYMLDNLPIVRGCIDSTKGSIGRQLGEESEQLYGQRSLMFEFTSSNKQIIVAGIKGRMENGALCLPPCARDTDIEREFLRIKRKTTLAGNVVFDAERTDEGHADIFYSLAMLSTLFSLPSEGLPYSYNMRMPEPELLRDSPFGKGESRIITQEYAPNKRENRIVVQAEKMRNLWRRN